jgi:hypothetical protein
VNLVPSRGNVIGHKKAQKAQKQAVGISGTYAPFAPCGPILLFESWLRRRLHPETLIFAD